MAREEVTLTLGGPNTLRVEESDNGITVDQVDEAGTSERVEIPGAGPAVAAHDAAADAHADIRAALDAQSAIYPAAGATYNETEHRIEATLSDVAAINAFDEVVLIAPLVAAADAAAEISFRPTLSGGAAAPGRLRHADGSLVVGGEIIANTVYVLLKSANADYFLLDAHTLTAAEVADAGSVVPGLVSGQLLGALIATVPAGMDGRNGSFERTIFRAAATQPAQPTAPVTVANAGDSPTLPANTHATPPDSTQPIWASIQRRAAGNATAVTYTTWRRWDGTDGAPGTPGADGPTFTKVADQAAAEAMPDDDDIFYWWPA